MARLPWLALAGLLLATAASPADDTRSSSASLNAAIQRSTLKNGLQLVLAPDPQAAAIDVAVWYDAGSRHDRAGKTGLAHLFEHLMFRGSSRFAEGEHTRLIRAEGGSSGAFASPDFLCFYETLPPDAMDLAFRLEADRMTGLLLSQAGLDAERRNVGGERARRASVLSRGLERLYRLAYNTSPYRWPIYGEPADLSKLTLADAQDFYRQHFGPSNAVVTVTGRFDPAQALAAARKAFEPLKGTAGKPAAIPMDKPQTAERRAVDTAGSPVRALMVAWRVPARTDTRWPALDLLSVVLGRGTGSRLNRALVGDQPSCSSVDGDLESHKDESLIYFSAALLPRADSTEVEKRMLGEIGRLTAEPIGEGELERAKRQLETAAWLSIQTSHGRGQALGQSVMLAGDPQDFTRQLERIRACTANDLMRVATLLDPAKREVLWVSATGAGGQP
jgi:zinc protease